MGLYLYDLMRYTVYVMQVVCGNKETYSGIAPCLSFPLKLALSTMPKSKMFNQNIEKLFCYVSHLNLDSVYLGKWSILIMLCQILLHKEQYLLNLLPVDYWMWFFCIRHIIVLRCCWNILARLSSRQLWAIIYLCKLGWPIWKYICFDANCEYSSYHHIQDP